MTRKEQFDLAVKMVRWGHSSLDIEAAIEAEGPTGGDVRPIIAEAQKYARETKEAALECAIEAFKQGESFLEVCNKIEACGFSPWHSELIAGEAKAKAELVEQGETKESK